MFWTCSTSTYCKWWGDKVKFSFWRKKKESLHIRLVWMIAWMPKERHPKGRSLDFFPSQGRSTNRVRFEANCDRFISCKPFHFQELKVILLANDETLFLCEHFLRICWSIKKIIIIIFNCHFHSAQKCIKTFKRTFTVIVIGKKKKSTSWPQLCCKWLFDGVAWRPRNNVVWLPLGLSYVANCCKWFFDGVAWRSRNSVVWLPLNIWETTTEDENNWNIRMNYHLSLSEYKR